MASVEVLAPFSGVRPCPKCGFGDIGTTYMAPGDDHGAFREQRRCRGVGQEHLDRTCRRCFYFWPEQVDPASPAAPSDPAAPTDPSRVEDIRARVAAAEPGPWVDDVRWLLVEVDRLSAGAPAPVADPVPEMPVDPPVLPV